MNKVKKRHGFLIYVILAMMIYFISFGINNVFATSETTLTFSNDTITETISGSGYEISGTTLTISSAGTYRIKGTCTEGNIEVKKGVTDVVLILDNLTLTSSETAPIVIKKNSASVTIKLVGTSTLTNNEDPDNENSTDETIADAFEGAAIKVKSASSLTITGSGTLNIIGNTKNGIKGGATSSIIINNGTLNIDATNNGLACDGTIEINKGTINIDAGNEGIKLSPDEDDTESTAELTINGGIINIEADGDGIQTVGNIIINGWPIITINSGEDGIQTRSDFTLNNGTLDITTFGGYNVSGFDSDTMSAKGIKASPSDETTSDATNLITINSGTITLNTRDDAIHSDGYVTINGGTLNIQTGDDGVHADTSLVVGTDGGLERDPEINVNYSYEGLEAGNVYIYSGKIYVIATDDGINAAGGSSSGSDPGNGGGNNFNPGGGSGKQSATTQSSSDYAIYIYGGQIYINVEGDGIDSNENIYFYGGTTEVWGMKSGGDNEPIDHDGNLVIQNATIFASGSKGMEYVHSGITTTNQSYIYSTTSYSSGKIINIKNASSTIVYSAKAPKNVAYTFFTSPTTTSSFSIATATSLTTCKSNSWNQTWDSGTITTVATSSTNGVITYTSNCSTTERKTYIYQSNAEHNVINKTNGKATVTIGNDSDTSDFTSTESDGTIEITSSAPCIILTTIDSGETYERLEATSTSNSNTYTFEIDENETQDIYVILAGDVDLNGTVTATDALIIKKSKLSSSNTNYTSLSTMQNLIADVDNNGTISATDALRIKKSKLSSSNSSYTALDW